MKAYLLTRCGCKRIIETSYPPAPYILLPLRKRLDWLTAGDDITAPNFGTRKFNLREDFGAYAEYEEVVP